MRREVAHTLGFAFSHLSDKQLVWNDLHRLTNDENSDVRYRATLLFVLHFHMFPISNWYGMTYIDLLMMKTAMLDVGQYLLFDSAFSHVPDKQLIWNDLHRLTTDENRDVRCRAASVSWFFIF